MNKSTRGLIIFFILIISLQAAATTPPQRVLSLSPAITEVIFALHLESVLVGVSDFSDYPEAAKKIPSVGPYTKPNMEKIVSFQPDLIVLPQEGPSDIKARLETLHLHYIVVKMRELGDIPQAAEAIASALGHPKAGQDFATNWTQERKDILKNVKHKEIHTLIEIQNQPLIVAGPKTFLHEMVESCGGINIIKKEGYPTISAEIAMGEQLDLILLVDYFPSLQEAARARGFWRNIPSTKETQVEVIDPNLASRPGPRLLAGLKRICKAIQEGHLKNE